MSAFQLETWLAATRKDVDVLLDARLPLPSEDPGRLVEAMRYSLLAPGKRLRPILALAAAKAVGAPIEDRTRIAAASVELVHCYSLIHDDLPAMDNDDVRRGRPTNHKAFDEATAILAGDALLTLAFEWLAEAGQGSTSPERFLSAVAALARGAGMVGMARGQARDMIAKAPSTLEELEHLHVEKTGALFRAALEVGAAVAGATIAQKDALAEFGICYGIAFQHADDQEDKEHTEFSPGISGRIRDLVARASEALRGFDERADPLRALARRLAPN